MYLCKEKKASFTTKNLNSTCIKKKTKTGLQVLILWALEREVKRRHHMKLETSPAVVVRLTVSYQTSCNKSAEDELSAHSFSARHDSSVALSRRADHVWSLSKFEKNTQTTAAACWKNTQDLLSDNFHFTPVKTADYSPLPPKSIGGLDQGFQLHSRTHSHNYTKHDDA